MARMARWSQVGSMTTPAELVSELASALKSVIASMAGARVGGPQDDSGVPRTREKPQSPLLRPPLRP